MIYLIHLDTPLHHAQHYLGFTDGLNPAARLLQHRAGEGAKMLAACNRKGITYNVVATWPGDRNEERRMKNWKKIRAKCPICSPQHTEKCKK